MIETLDTLYIFVHISAKGKEPTLSTHHIVTYDTSSNNINNIRASWARENNFNITDVILLPAQLSVGQILFGFIADQIDEYVQNKGYSLSKLNYKIWS